MLVIDDGAVAAGSDADHDPLGHLEVDPPTGEPGRPSRALKTPTGVSCSSFGRVGSTAKVQAAQDLAACAEWRWN